MHRKKSIHQIDVSLLAEPEMSSEDWRDFEEGWRLFNARQYWHAHERWECVWKRHSEESRIFFQGIIQLAAGCHLMTVENRRRGAKSNLEKARVKLHLFPERFLRVHVHRLLLAIESMEREMHRLGDAGLDRLDRNLFPVVNLTPLP